MVGTNDGWQFITVTNPNEIRTHTNKRRVRSQAMRSFRQGKRRSSEVQPSSPPGENDHARTTAAAPLLRDVDTASTEITVPKSCIAGLQPLYGTLVPGLAPVLSDGRVHALFDSSIKHIESSHRETLSYNEAIQELAINQEIPAYGSGDEELYQQEGRIPSPTETADIISFWEVANIDPFQTCPATIGISERALIHHWITVFGTMMFGKTRSSVNPMAEVWIPDALSNEASFHGMLSYAAAHLAHLGGQDGSAHGTMYKIKAINSIQGRLNNSNTAFCDTTVSAVLRQISIEDRFGSVEIARLHRAGLDKIIEKRGCSSRLRDNWKLELLLYWYLITSKPTFHFDSVVDHEEPTDLEHGPGCKDATGLRHPKQLPDLLAKFFDFINEIKLLATQEIRSQGLQLSPVDLGTGPANRLLYLLANAPGPSRGTTHDIIEETCRLASLFYMSLTKINSLRLGVNDLELLNNTLNETQMAWEYSLEMLLWVLLKRKGPKLVDPEKVQLVMSLMDVAKLLQKESWNIIKEMLIGFLYGDLKKAADIDEESIVFMNDLIGTQR